MASMNQQELLERIFQDRYENLKGKQLRIDSYAGGRARGLSGSYFNTDAILYL